VFECGCYYLVIVNANVKFGTVQFRFFLKLTMYEGWLGVQLAL